MERDSANMYVLEAIIISMVLLGAAYAVSTLQDSSIENARPRAELGRTVSDALKVLAGLDDGNGTKLLDLYLLEALHCGVDDVPSPTDCQGRRSKNLTVKLDNYLPLGSGYAISLGNGVTSRTIYESPLPEGEAVSASIVFEPEWNTSFVFTEFSCYPAGVDVNATIIPLDRARTTWARWGNVTIGAAETEGKRAYETHWWNVTVPAATRPATGVVNANVTSNATLRGSTAYGVCDHGGLTTQLRDALKATEFGPAASSVPVNAPVDFVADLDALVATGVTINGATVTVYEPLPTYSNGPDTWIEAGPPVTLTGGAGTWTAPTESLYGKHPALLRVSLTVGSNTFELRRASLVDVALPTGEVPIHPPYRAVVRAWLADWG